MLADCTAEQLVSTETRLPLDLNLSLVRALQCSQCSRPYTKPVSLPCGHTFCYRCLSDPQVRENISYPNTPECRKGISCHCCSVVHLGLDVRQDVTLSKIMDKVRQIITTHISQYTMTWEVSVEDVASGVADMSLEAGNQSPLQLPPAYTGARLATLFQEAEEGQLDPSAEVDYAVPGELDEELWDTLRRAILMEMDCGLCYSMLLDPTTTLCGHTLCRQCLIRAFDHDNSCPVCRQPSHMPRSLAGHSKNNALAGLLNALCPAAVEERRRHVKEDEASGGGVLDIPLFVCMLTFPSMPTWLHIFEPRYRLMIRRCLEGNGQFGMLDYNRNHDPQGELGVTHFKRVGTMLQIREYNLLHDGRSYLDCVGIYRFRVLEHGIRDGYDVGRIERIEDVPLNQEMTMEANDRKNAPEFVEDYARRYPFEPRLTAATYPDLLSTEELFQRCREFVDQLGAKGDPGYIDRQIKVWGDPPDDPAVFPWWFATVMPKLDYTEKHALLEMTTVRNRLKMVYMMSRRIQVNLSVSHFPFSPERI